MRIQTPTKPVLFASALRMGILGVFAVFSYALILSLIGAALSPGHSAAATSSTINFQARLETSAGAIAPDGNYDVEFNLYSVSSGGTAEWTEDYLNNNSQGVHVVNGYLTVNLGSITAFPGTINWNQQQWLTMNIGGTNATCTPFSSCSPDGEMNPRLLLTATPYAFQAGALSTTDGSGHTGTLSFPASLTNATDTITLPDASGTVCLQNSSSCGFATGSGSAFLQGGNSFGAQAVLGTNDTNSLALRTNNSNRLVLDTSGNLQFQQASTLNIASNTTGLALTIQGGAATSGTNVGGNLMLQGGAGASTGASGSVIIKSNTNNSTTAFQIQNAGGTSLLTVDTANGKITVNASGDSASTTVATINAPANFTGNWFDLQESGTSYLQVSSVMNGAYYEPELTMAGGNPAGQAIRFGNANGSFRIVPFNDSYTYFQTTQGNLQFSGNNGSQGTNAILNFLYGEVTGRLGVGVLPLSGDGAITIHDATTPPGTSSGDFALGYSGSYSWIQGYQNNPLKLNPLANNIILGNTTTNASTTINGTALVKPTSGHDSTTAFQVQNASGAGLFTVDSSNTALILGNDGTPAALTVRGGAASGTDVPGANLTFDASNGTGSGGSGDIIFRTASGSGPSVTFDAGTYGGSGTNISTLSWSHTTTTQNSRLLIVDVMDEGATVTSVKYNGVSLTSESSLICNTLTGANCTQMWYLVNPPSGTNTIQVTLSGSQHLVAGAATYYNVNQTTPFGALSSATNPSNASSISTGVTTTSTRQMVVDSVVFWNATITPNAGQTTSWTSSNTTSLVGASSRIAATGSAMTVGWSSGGVNDAWAIIAVPINPGAAGSTSADLLTDVLHLANSGFVGIQNSNPQYTLDVTGTGDFTTSVQAPLLQSASGTALTITGNAASTWSTTTGNITLQAGSGIVSLGTSTSLTSSGALTVTGGGALALKSTTSSAITLDSGTTGAINIGNGGNSKTIQIGASNSAITDTINIGNNTNASGISTISIGSTKSTSTTTIQGGTGGISLNSGTGNITIGTSANNKTISIGAIGSTANTTTVDIADTTGAAQTITIGSTNTTSTTTIQGGTGNINLKTATTLGTASSRDGTLIFNNSAGANTITLQTQAVNPASSATIFLPTAGATGSQCLSSTSGSTSTSTTLQFTSCGGGTTLQSAYNGSAGASPSIDMTSASAGLTLQNDNTSPITGELFGVHAQTVSGLGANLFTVDNNGNTLVKTRTGNDSATAFRVQNAAGTNILDVDTSGLRVNIGAGATGEPTPTLLVLDSETGSTSDPTEVDGAMYYNASTQSYRCGINGFWTECSINNIQYNYDFEDEFMGGNSGTGVQSDVGQLGWDVAENNTCSEAYNQTGPSLSHDHPGTFKLSTASTAASWCEMQQGGTAAGTSTLSEIVAPGDDIKTTVAFGSGVSNYLLRVGINNQSGTTAATSGAWFQFTSTNGLEYCYANNATATCAATTLTPSANTWYQLEIRFVSSTAITFIAAAIPSGVPEVHALTGITYDPGSTNPLSPSLLCENDPLGTGVFSCYIDYYQWRGVITSSSGR